MEVLKRWPHDVKWNQRNSTFLLPSRPAQRGEFWGNQNILHTFMFSLGESAHGQPTHACKHALTVWILELGQGVVQKVQRSVSKLEVFSILTWINPRRLPGFILAGITETPGIYISRASLQLAVAICARSKKPSSVSLLPVLWNRWAPECPVEAWSSGSWKRTDFSNNIHNNNRRNDIFKWVILKY